MPYVFRLSDLPKLDLQVDRGTDFEAWKAQWTSYSTLSGLSGESGDTQVQALTLCFSRETLTVVNNLGLSADDRNSVGAIITAIKRHVDGHINESMERRRLRHRVQQPGESFDNYLVSLWELAKTCNFCSATCSQKSIRDQIIEGLLDGDTIEELLKQQNLTLDATITTCCAQEAAKEQRQDITDHSVLAIRQPDKQRMKHALTLHTGQAGPKPCPGCGLQAHQGGRVQCPAYKQTCCYCHKVGHFARVCHGRQLQKKPPLSPATQAIGVTDDDVEQLDRPPGFKTISLKQVSTIDPAPTVKVHLRTHHGDFHAQVLPDSGADISTAGEHILLLLNEYLLPSEFTPRAANGQRMHAIGKMRVCFQLAGNEYEGDVYIFTHLSGVIISWRAAKALKLLSPHYPLPPPVPAPSEPRVRTTTAADPIPTLDDLKREYTTVFDGNIRTMDGEEFHISLTADARPFCVNIPRSIPFAYRDKLKAELELLQTQHIIAPVTEARVVHYNSGCSEEGLGKDTHVCGSLPS